MFYYRRGIDVGKIRGDIRDVREGKIYRGNFKVAKNTGYLIFFFIYYMLRIICSILFSNFDFCSKLEGKLLWFFLVFLE